MSLLDTAQGYRVFQAPFSSQKVAPVLRRLDLMPSQSILDLGCGPGVHARSFDRFCYYGVDLNSQYIAGAQRKAVGRFFEANVTDLSVLKDKQFDCAMANSLFHHLDDAQVHQLFEELRKLLSPGAIFHLVDMVLPERKFTAGYLLAKLDRGEFVRTKGDLLDLVLSYFESPETEDFQLTFGPLGLWHMIYLRGKLANV